MILAPVRLMRNRMATALQPLENAIATRSPLFIGLQVACFAVILLYAIFFQTIRILGPAAFALAVGCAVLLWLSMVRWYVQRHLLALALVALIYAVMSSAGFLAWDTLMFQRGAILQQSLYAFLLPILVPVFAYYHERVVLRDRVFMAMDTIVLLLCVVSKVLYALSSGAIANLGIVQLFNVEAIFTFVLVRRLYFTDRPSLLLKVLVVTVLAATAGSFQSVLVAFFLACILVAPQMGRTILLCFVLGLVAISLTAVPFADAIWQVDPNTGIRLFFWRDAIERLVQSYGIGQGFGTETIRPVYELSSGDVSIAALDQDDFIMVGSHNAFIDAGYRMGLVGMTILIAYVAGLFHKVAAPRGVDRSFDYFACALLFVILMVNVGLVSINFLFGSAFVLGWLAFRTANEFVDERRVRQIVTGSLAFGMRSRHAGGA